VVVVAWFSFVSLPWWALAILLIVLAVVVLKFVKKILVNTVLGLIALFVINWLGSPYGVKIPINVVTVVVSALLGLAGVGALIILALLGIKV
jgi:inhibitor of the pro-sigma K processing machinery